MLAIHIPVPGGPEALIPFETPTPEPKPGEVLIRVAAAGINAPDLGQRRGTYDPPPGASPLPGLEVSGEIVGTGEQVVALCNGGGYAEYVAVPAGQVLPLPQGWNLVAGAALPETFFTVWQNVFHIAGLQSGEWLLVQGGSSGIGVTAIQLAKALGARVIVTAGSDDKCAACLALGADHAINYRTHDFVAEVQRAVEQCAGDNCPEPANSKRAVDRQARLAMRLCARGRAVELRV